MDEGLEGLLRLSEGITTAPGRPPLPEFTRDDFIKSISREMSSLAGDLYEPQYKPLLSESTSINSLSPQPIPSTVPIHDLPDFPVEILQRIFQLTLPTESEPILNTKQAPLLLCYVSPTWRSIALGTPELWTSLGVLIDHHALGDGDIQKSYTAAVKEWFGRSKDGQSLAYRFFLRVSSNAEQDPDMDKFSTDILLPYLARCRLLDVGADKHGVLRPFYSHPPGSVGSLKSLVLRIPHLSREENVDFSVFQQAPLLKMASLASVPVEFEAMLPWAQLTHLTALDVPTSTWKRLIRALPLLEEGVFYILNLGDNQAEVHPEVTLPYVKSLAFTVTGELDGNTFHNLRFPALTSFEGRGIIGYEANMCVNADSEDFIRVVSSLTHSVIDHFSIETPKLIQLLGLSNSTLQTLEISGDFDFGLLFDAINCRDEKGNYKSDIFLPRLSTLILDFPIIELKEDEVEFPFDAFVKMLESRCWVGNPNPSPPIARLRILRVSTLLKELFAPLGKAIEPLEGDDISISFSLKRERRKRFTYRYQELKHWR